MKRTHFLLAIALGVALGALLPTLRSRPSAANARSGAIEGAAFVDANGNGAYDVDEAGVIGVTVRLTGAGEDRRVKTDTGGLYRFAELADGTYTVAVLPEAPYTVSGRDTYEDLDVAGDNLTSVDFALTKPDRPEPVVSQADAAATVSAKATATRADTAATVSAKATATRADAATATEVVAATATAEPATATLEPVATEAPTAVVVPAEQMPQTGFADWGSNSLLAAALAVLVIVAAAGWLMERRG